MRRVSVGKSDVGRKRSINEDAFFCDDDMGFYVVADGVGVHIDDSLAQGGRYREKKSTGQR